MIGKIIGEILRKERRENGLTIKMLAEVSGITKRTIIRLEKGEIKNPSILLILSYLRAVGVSFGDFFSQLDEMELKELLPKEIEIRDLPKKTKKTFIEYAIGMEYQRSS